MTRPDIRIVLGALALVACGGSSAGQNDASPDAGAGRCRVSDDDRAWIERSLAAWRLTSQQITEIGAPGRMLAVFFDEDCTLTSPTALSGGDPANWNANAHAGTISLPDGTAIPSGVTSFMKPNGDQPFFVMATPAVWRAAGVPGGGLGLDTLMTAVLLHEATHAAQFPTYGQQVSDLAERHSLPESFNDDSVQQQFQGNEAFVSAINREIDLFFAAAAAGNDSDARRLASEARQLMRERRARWFVGQDEYLGEAEDLWLTLEGSGQWAGYRWLRHPGGGAVPEDRAMSDFGKRSRWWTQKEGLALFLVIERLQGPAWKGHAFGDGARTATQMLDAALTLPAQD